MATKKLTNQLLKTSRLSEVGRLEFWDTEVKGLGFRVTSNGAKTWNIMYRFRGQQKRLKIGTYPNTSLLKARKRARKAFGDLEDGIDPAEKLRALKAPLPRVETLREVSKEFIERYARLKNKTWLETERIIERDINPHLGDLPFKEIQRIDAVRLIDKISDQRTPYSGRNVFVTLRRIFNWGIERGLLDKNPLAGVPSPVKPTSRDRVLSEKEIVNLWEGCDSLGYPFGGFIKILLLTGQRRSEVAKMKWSKVDFEKRLWTVPREITKSDRGQDVPLSDLAFEVLSKLPLKEDCDFVFSTNGETPISGFSKAKSRVDRLSGVSGWRIHDVRRTVASGMARLRISPHVIEKVLNHSNGIISGVAAVYNRHGYLEEKAHALETWGNYVDDLVNNTSGGNVIEFKLTV